MKNIKGFLAIFILILSWLAMYWLTGSRTPWNYFSANERQEGVSVYLGDIPTQNYDRMGFTKAVVDYVPSEDGWIVGTERGELFLFDNAGNRLWKRNLGIGKLIALCISNDSKLALVGESSPEGHLYAVDTHSGDIVWQYKAADFIGSDVSQRSYPAVVHIVVDKENNVYANMYRFLMTKTGVRAYKGKNASRISSR